MFSATAKPSLGPGLARLRAGLAPQRLAASCLAGAVACLLAQALHAKDLANFAQVRASHQPSDVPLLSRHGEPLALVRMRSEVRVGPWLALHEMSPALRQAIVQSEDQRFWSHTGVDWAALAGTAFANAWNSKTRGASTVTMQLAALLDDDLARPNGGRSAPGKLSQMASAQQLEHRWSKAQILEAYLNRVPLRGELVGIAAGAQQLFGKHASGLDEVQAAILAVLVRAPNAPERTVAQRACTLLKQMKAAVATSAAPSNTAAATGAASLGHLAALEPCAGVETTTAQALARKPGPMLLPQSAPNLAPHLARLMAREAASAQHGKPSGQASAGKLNQPTALHSTLDARVQRIAVAALKRQLAELQGREVDDGAVLVLDNASGQVLAWVGSAGAASSASEVDAVLARRQPGSTVKPFVYALALQRQRITAASVLDDSPLQLNTGNSALYLPRNYDHQYRGAVSARTALASSLNVPTVRVAGLLEPEDLFERMNAAGLELSHNAGYHGAALALGTADVSLLKLTNAYRLFAQGGQFSAVRWWADSSAKLSTPAKAEAAATRVFSPEVAWLVGHILADPSARASGFGFDSPLVTRGFAAAKTGTSKDMRDNWCIGFTSRYTVGVWVGNAGGQAMHNVSGMAGAAPVWREIVQHLHEGSVSVAPKPPAGLVEQAGEYFIAGTQGTPQGAQHGPPNGPLLARPDSARSPLPAPIHRAVQAAPLAAVGHFGIQVPRDGTVIVLDPEIPASSQQLSIRGEAGRWWMDGRPLGQGRHFNWPLRPGQHVLRWQGEAASEEVRFEVRAAPVHAAAQVKANVKTRAPTQRQ